MLACGAWACASDDPSLERRGDPNPEPMMDGAAGNGEAGGDDRIPFCDAFAVIRAKCQRCHQDPPQNGAPAPFLTYEDTQANYASTGKPFFEFMIGDVERGTMPYVFLNGPPTNLMPPVEPLTPEEKATLLGWLKQGALPLGGTDCP
jgi:hypothetical protein